MPFIIEEDDDDEKCIIENCQECKENQEYRDAVDISLCFTRELRSQSRTDTEYQVFHTQTMEMTSMLAVLKLVFRAMKIVMKPLVLQI